MTRAPMYIGLIGLCAALALTSRRSEAASVRVSCGDSADDRACDLLVRDYGGPFVSELVLAADPCQGEPLLDVDVQLDLGHSQPGDLGMRLTAPSGGDATLSAPTCGTDLIVPVTFSDLPLPSDAPYAVHVAPLAPLAAGSPVGTWSLSITDANRLGYGRLRGWALRFTCQDPATPLADDGAACTVHGECASDHCVDDVCCESACGGGADDCEACAVRLGAAVDGRCGDLRVGTLYEGVDVGAACDPTAVGCAVSLLACGDGGPRCEAQGETPAEMCDNGIDDDCDDQTDEGCPVVVDSDLDGIADADDNCPTAANADQRDDDLDGVGNACETETTRESDDCRAGGAGLLAGLMGLALACRLRSTRSSG